MIVLLSQQRRKGSLCALDNTTDFLMTFLAHPIYSKHTHLFIYTFNATFLVNMYCVPAGTGWGWDTEMTHKSLSAIQEQPASGGSWQGLV